MSDYDDLVKRLRDWDYCWPAPGLEHTVESAATAIETLRRERDEAERLLDLTIKQRDEARAAEIEAKEHEAITATFLETCTQQRDAAIARAEKAEVEVVRLRSILAKDEHTIMIAYEDGDHQRLARSVGKLLKERDALRALLREAREWIVEGKVDFSDVLADRIDAALKGGEDEP